MHYTTMDLNSHYGNNDGAFVAGSSKYFADCQSNENWVTIKDGGTIELDANLKKKDGKYQHATVNLSYCIVNSGKGWEFVKKCVSAFFSTLTC